MQLTEILNDAHMPAVECAKKVLQSKVKRDYRSIDFSKAAAAQVAQLFNEKDSEGGSSMIDMIQIAARTAAQGLDGNEDLLAWTKYTKGGYEINNFYTWVTFVIIAIRLFYQVTVNEYLNAVPDTQKGSVKGLISFFEEKYDRSLGEVSLAEVYEEVILPSSHPKETLETQLNGFKLLMSIRAVMGHDKWTDEVRLSESALLTATFHQQLREGITEVTDPYMSATESNGAHTNAGKRRKCKAINMLCYPVFARLIASLLSQDNFSEENLGLSAEEVTDFTLALCYSQPSKFDRNPLVFCQDESLISSITPGRAKELLDGDIKTMLDSMRDAQAVFEDTHLFVDITDDLRNLTRNTYENVSSYINDSHRQG